MFVIVCYDVNTVDKHGEKRLRRIAVACKDYGVRVQYSVFECRLEPRDWALLRDRLLNIFDPKVDSLRFYFLGDNDFHKTEHNGVRKPFDPTAPIVV